jgi:hypothetical protein
LLSLFRRAPHTTNEREVHSVLNASLSDLNRACHSPEETVKPIQQKMVEFGPVDRRLVSLAGLAIEAFPSGKWNV